MAVQDMHQVVQDMHQVVQDPRKMRRQRSGNVSVRKSNPPERSGNISRCLVCDSIMHWIKDCPHKDEAHV